LAALATALLLGGCTALSFAVANLPAHAAGVTRTAELPYGSDTRQKLDVYQPAKALLKSAVAGKVPVIVFWYGGSWTGGSRAEYRFVGVALAQLGYVVVIPDYRLYPKVRFPAFLDDGGRAVAWVQQHINEYGGDATRIVLMGHSAGAHLAAMLVADGQYLRRAQVDAGHIAGLIGLSGPYDLMPNTATLNRIFDTPYTPQDWQVTAKVSGRLPPTLLIHGVDDSLVRSHVSEQFAALLRARGTRVELRIYKSCSHACPLAALSVPARHQAPTLADVAAFMAGI
jgi:acetyl esterase/lipase